MHRSIFLIKYLLTSFIVAIHPCNSVITEAGIDVEGTNNYTSTVPCLPIDFVTGRRPSPSSVAAMIESAPSPCCWSFSEWFVLILQNLDAVKPHWELEILWLMKSKLISRIPRDKRNNPKISMNIWIHKMTYNCTMQTSSIKNSNISHPTPPPPKKNRYWFFWVHNSAFSIFVVIRCNEKSKLYFLKIGNLLHLRWKQNKQYVILSRKMWFID